MLGQRNVRFARLAAVPALLLALLGADCSDNIVDEILPGGGEECLDPSRTAVLAMYPAPNRLVPGGTLEVTVRIYQGCNVAATPFRLNFNPDHLRFDSGALGPFMLSGGSNVSFVIGEDTQNPGTLVVGIARLGADPEGNPSGSGDLCTIKFEVLPAAVLDGETSIAPFNFKVFQPGLVEQPSIFEPLTI